MKLGHVHLKVNDLEESVRFYEDLFGLTVREREGRYVFLSDDQRHHVLALQEVPGTSSPVGRDQPGLYHFAIEVNGPDELRSYYDKASQHVDRVTPVDHGISRSLYLEDPSGNGIEIYYDAREETGTRDWEGQNNPFDP